MLEYLPLSSSSTTSREFVVGEDELKWLGNEKKSAVFIKTVP